MILRRIADGIKRQDWVTVLIEFVLIFASVILALQFDNWNTERQEKNREREVLSAIAEDLRANITSFTDNIAFDENSIAACSRVIETIENRQDWTDKIAESMYSCRWWTSPYLYSAAYTGLKSNGTDMISNLALRRQITELYESEYSYLVDDTDRGFWDLQTLVILPALNRAIRPELSEDPARPFSKMYPIVYENLLKDEAFLTMLHSKRMFQIHSIVDQKVALESTQNVLTAIEDELEGGS